MRQDPEHDLVELGNVGDEGSLARLAPLDQAFENTMVTGMKRKADEHGVVWNSVWSGGLLARRHRVELVLCDLIASA